jgi:pyruvate dehydrogenase E2 component (dihydrolipoamide acetyltransferase)
MLSDVVMPQLGMSMTEGTVISWALEIGARVEKGDILLTLQTDKVEIEIESTESGYVSEILVGAGETVPVGTVIARLSDKSTAQ